MNFLADALLFFGAALIVVPLCKRLGLSAVLGYLAAGLLIGPPGLGLIGNADEVLHFAELGVVLLLFIIGLELQPRRLWVMRRAVFGLGSLQVLASTAVIAAALLLLGVAGAAALLMGFALALSSTAFVLQLLGEQKKLHHAHGRAAFGVLLLQDVAVIPVLALVNVLAVTGAAAHAPLDPWGLLAVAAGAVAARWLLRPVLRWVALSGIHELFTAAALALVIGAALAMASVGLSMALGAFIAGLVVADSPYRHLLETDVNPFKGLLLGLFFIAVGMSVNLDLLGAEPLTVAGLTIGLMLVKALVLLPLARLYGLNWADALRTALALSQGGEFAFVLLTAGVVGGLVAERAADLAVLSVTLSMAATPLVVALGERLLREPDVDRPYDQVDTRDNQVVIAGFGRVGQIVARVLTMRHIPFTGLEVNPHQVDFVRRFGHEIFYGDATRLDLLQAANVASARALVVAVGNVEASLRIVEQVRDTCPGVAILARATNRDHEMQLRELGVDFVLRDTLLSSLGLASELLQRLGMSVPAAEAAVAQFRQHDAETLLKQLAVFKDADALRRTTLDAQDELTQLFSEDAQAATQVPPEAVGGVER